MRYAAGMSTSLSHGPTGDALMAAARDRSAVEELQCHALLALLETCESVSGALKRDLSRHAHTQSGVNVLAYILRHDAEIVSAKNIADGLALPRQTVEATLGRLEISGLIARERSALDRQLFTLKATDAGRQAFSSALSHSLASITRVMSALDPSEVAALDLACARLRQVAAPP